MNNAEFGYCNQDADPRSSPPASRREERAPTTPFAQPRELTGTETGWRDEGAPASSVNVTRCVRFLPGCRFPAYRKYSGQAHFDRTAEQCLLSLIREPRTYLGLSDIARMAAAQPLAPGRGSMKGKLISEDDASVPSPSGSGVDSYETPRLGLGGCLGAARACAALTAALGLVAMALDDPGLVIDLLESVPAPRAAPRWCRSDASRAGFSLRVRMKRSTQPLPSGSCTRPAGSAPRKGELTLVVVATNWLPRSWRSSRPRGDARGEAAEAARPSAHRLQRLEPAGPRAGVDAHALGRAVIDGDEDR